MGPALENEEEWKKLRGRAQVTLMDDNVYITSIDPRPITSYPNYMPMCVPSLTEGGGWGHGGMLLLDVVNFKSVFSSSLI